MEPDLPVAAPDHAETIRRAIPQLDTETWYTDAQIRDAHVALDALLAERQQDKERIERLETALRFYADQNNWTQPTSWGGRIHDDESHAIDDYGKHARAALAIEEDSNG